MRPPLPCPPPAGFDELFSEFVASTLDVDVDRVLPALAEATDWSAATAQLVAAAGPAYQRRRRDRERQLTAALAATAAVVSVESIRRFATSRIVIEPPTDFRTAGDVDVCYIKINHGFWEQLYALFGVADPERMRVTEVAGLRWQYVESAFLDALAAACLAGSHAHGDRTVFTEVHLGVSLTHGAMDHAGVLAGFAERSPDHRRIVVGAAIGMAGWWETLFPERPPVLHDGCFPKQGLATGLLRENLQWAVSGCERVVFIVPPHLAGIRLADCPLPQETVLIPPTTVHASWAASLLVTSRHVLCRLAGDGRVLVLTQSAVFSAVLGLFLAFAKRRLLPAESRLRFFDLGQVLDVAAPATGGPWVQRYLGGQPSPAGSLFHIPSS